MARGYNYLLESHRDEIDHVLRPIRKAVVELGLPLRSIDDEWAASQVETTFDVQDGLAAADSVLLFRGVVKQIARRRPPRDLHVHAPHPRVYASGWHLHTSLVDPTTGENAMVPGTDAEALSEAGTHYVGGTLAHGAAASVFATPSVNGYRRRRPHSLAPDRLIWGLDDRAATMRVIGGAGDPATHVENRVGEPSANPYLYIAAQAAAGIDGVLNKTTPGPRSDDPYAADVPQVPTSLAAALEELSASSFFRGEFGDRFVDYLVTMKRSEVSRYEAHVAEQGDPQAYAAEVTEWEHREYFELFCAAPSPSLQEIVMAVEPSAPSSPPPAAATDHGRLGRVLEDHALERVPDAERRGGWGMLWNTAGVGSTLVVLAVGAAVTLIAGVGWGLLVGAVTAVLGGVLGWTVGHVSYLAGTSSTVTTRYHGLGSRGSALASLIFAGMILAFLALALVGADFARYARTSCDVGIMAVGGSIVVNLVVVVLGTLIVQAGSVVVGARPAAGPALAATKPGASIEEKLTGMVSANPGAWVRRAGRWPRLRARLRGAAPAGR